MSILDLIDDGTFDWLHHEPRSSAAYDRANRVRVDVNDGSWHRAVPAVMHGASYDAFADRAHLHLSAEIVRSDRCHLLAAVGRACDAVRIFGRERDRG